MHACMAPPAAAGPARPASRPAGPPRIISYYIMLFSILFDYIII